MRRIIGEERARSGFLFFPKEVFGEWRWLEFAKWKERVNINYKWEIQGWID